MKNASLLRRFGAMLYDSLLVMALLILATLPFVGLRDGEPVAPYDRTYQLTLLLVIYLFFVGFWTAKGRTLGMQSWGLRVETPSGRLPTVGQASLRFAASILSWLPLGLGFLWQLWDKDSLTWHDKLSGTRLIHYPRRKQ